MASRVVEEDEDERVWTGSRAGYLNGERDAFVDDASRRSCPLCSEVAVPGGMYSTSTSPSPAVPEWLSPSPPPAHNLRLK